MWTKTFWKQTAEWAAKAFAAVLLTALGLPNGAEVAGVDVRDIGWLDALSYATGAALAIVLICMASAPVGQKSSPTIAPVDPPPPPDEAVRILSDPVRR